MNTKRCTCRNHAELFTALQESKNAGEPQEWRQMILKAHGFLVGPMSLFTESETAALFGEVAA